MSIEMNITSVPLYVVVWRCLDCEMITKIDSAWQTKAGADTRIAEMDKSQAGDTNAQVIGEILEVTAEI